MKFLRYQSTRAIVLAASLASNSCGSSPTAPAAPTSVAGAWGGTATLTGVNGGECLSPIFSDAVGHPVGVNALAIQQTGVSVTMKLSPFFPTGADCDYSGLITANAFNLVAANCGTYRSRRCEPFSGIPADQRVRDVSFVSASFSGNVSGNALSATAIETWNVYLEGTQTNVGVLTVTSRFNLSR